MPQESKRSIGYRSFLTCNDPKGVIEYGTIRKSKINNKEQKIVDVNGKEKKNLDLEADEDQKNYYESKKKEMGIIGEQGVVHTSPAALQLLDVPKGHQNMDDDAINSWKASRHDRETEDIIARDLLKEAADLQESLAMLTRLQDLSPGLTCYEENQNHKEKVVERGGRFSDVGGMESIQFRSDKYDHELGRRRRHSVGGMSPMRSSHEDIKRVIRDSLVRNNSFSKADVSEEESCDVPSTSSSQSSMVQHSSNFATSKSSLSSTASKKKTRGSNLIARLMGLEDPHSKSSTLSPRRPTVMENEKFPYQNKNKKPMFEVDLPMARNPLFVPQAELDSTQRSTFGEVLDTFKFRGLLRSKLLDCDQQKLNADRPAGMLPHKEERWNYDKPPIVIIKPIRSSSVDNKDSVSPRYGHKDIALDAKEILRKLRARKEAFLSDAAPSEASDLGEKHREAEKGCRCYQEGSGDSEEVLRKPEKKELLNAKEKDSSCHGIQKQQKRVTADKKKSLAQIRFKGEEKKKNATFDHEMKSQVMAPKLRERMQRIDVTKNDCPKQRVSDTTSCPIWKDRTHGKSNKSKVFSKNKLGDQRKVSKESAPSTIDRHGCKTDILETDTDIEHECTLVKDITVVVSDKLPQDELAVNASQVQVKDHNVKIQSPICEIKLMTTLEDSSQDHYIVNHDPALSSPIVDRDKELSDDDQVYKDPNWDEITLVTANNGGILSHCEKIPSSLHEVTLSASNEESSSTSKSIEGDNIRFGEHETITKGNITKLKLKSLLLSSPEFVTCAEELINLSTVDEQDLTNLNSNEYVLDVGSSSSSKVMLDYANEILEFMSDQNTQTPLPQYQPMKMITKRCVPLDLFVEKLSNGIKYLECYSGNDWDCIWATTDWFSSFFERDLRHDNVVVSEMWDAGWRNEFSLYEVETVVGELDKLVLGGLIDEVLADFMTLR